MCKARVAAQQREGVKILLSAVRPRGRPLHFYSHCNSGCMTCSLSDPQFPDGLVGMDTYVGRYWDEWRRYCWYSALQSACNGPAGNALVVFVLHDCLQCTVRLSPSCSEPQEVAMIRTAESGKPEFELWHLCLSADFHTTHIPLSSSLSLSFLLCSKKIVTPNPMGCLLDNCKCPYVLSTGVLCMHSVNHHCCDVQESPL